MPVLAITIITDGLIALVACGAPTWFVVSAVRKSQGRGKGPWPMAAVLWFVWIVVVYGSFVEPRMLQVNAQDVVLASSKAEATHELRVALISDTHLGAFRHEAWLRTVVDRINTLEPDVVIVAGDMASSLAGAGEFRPFKDLKTKYGTYAVLGNWDYRAGAVDVRKALGSQDVKLLVNRAVSLDVGGRTVSLIGLDDAKHGMPDIEAAMREVPEGALKLLLSHTPDAVLSADAFDVDLVLAGHTHCGQIRLPFIGSVAHLPTHIDQSYDCGDFQAGPTRLFITPGVGESTARARLFNPPEISLLTLYF